MTSEYLPNVADPVETLRAAAGTDALSLDDTATEDALIDAIQSAAAGQYIFVRLTAAAANEPIEAMLQRHDALIVAVNQRLAAVAKSVVYIFTGEPSMVRGRREVAAAAAAAPAPIAAKDPLVRPDTKQEVVAGATVNVTYTYFIRDRVLILFKNITYEDAPINVTDISVTEESDTVINVVLLATPATDNIHFNITGDGGYWNVDHLEFRNVVLTPTEFLIAALSNFSWHCSPSLILQTGGAFSPLHITGLQLEPVFGAFNASDPRTAFSDPWDCVGFTSAGIWGGLFVVLLMLAILSVGISWIMDIRTMDRFDDPKGKTIIVSLTE